MSTKEGFRVEDLKKLLIGSTSDKLFIIKFGAPWCGPCQRIKPLTDGTMSRLADEYGKRIVCVNICIDVDIELYGELKRRRVVNGVPVILAYRGTDMQEPWYHPMDSVSGADIEKIEAFFDRCETYVK
jgi:thiol-disulfide isomerase/thioredoxin